jgi:hypothetical protein
VQGLDELYLEYGDRGFLPISVVAQDAVGLTPDVTDAAMWGQELGLTYPVLADVDGDFFPIWDPEGVLPVMYLVDQDGVVVRAEVGGVESMDELEAQVAQLLDRR